jgi:methyl-accepting chemotaxis protein/methyl-accepting chemotaxis protein-1 (serine sensor receptor)
MTIGKKLTAAFGAMFVTVLGLSVGAFWQVQSLTSELNSAVHVTAKKQALAGEIRSNTADMLASEENIVLGSVLQRSAVVSQAKQDFRSQLSRIEQALSEYQPLVDSSNPPAALTALRQDLSSVSRAHDEMMMYLDKQQFDMVQKTFDETVMARVKEIASQAENLVSQERERLSGVTKSAEGQTTRGTWLIVSMFLLSLGAAGAVVWVIHQTNGQLRGLAVEVAGGSRRVGRAAAQVSGASQSLAQYASEQAAALEETSASMEQMRSVTHKNNDNSRGTAELMNKSMEVVGAAERTIREMSASMQEISASGEKITKVVKLIDDIAFQTKILSLNAAVEAARAGAAGAGFAVVAEQVGHLAQECAEAARSTAEMIDGTVAGVRDGSQKLGRAAEAIQEVVKHSSQVKVLVDEVHVGSQEQARGIDQVARAVTQMQQVTQKTASNAEEGAASGRELDGHAERLSGLVQRMHALVGSAATQDDDTRWSRLESPAPSRAALSNLRHAVSHETWRTESPAPAMEAARVDSAALPLESDFKEF